MLSLLQVGLILNLVNAQNYLLEFFPACQWLLFFLRRCSFLLEFSLFLPLQELSGSCESQSLAVVISNLAILRLLLLAHFLTFFVLGIAPAASACLAFKLSFRTVFYQTWCSELNS